MLRDLTELFRSGGTLTRVASRKSMELASSTLSDVLLTNDGPFTHDLVETSYFHLYDRGGIRTPDLSAHFIVQCQCLRLQLQKK